MTTFEHALQALPPDLACRCQMAIAQKRAAVEALARDGDTPLTLAGMQAALRELEECIAILSEFTQTTREERAA